MKTESQCIKSLASGLKEWRAQTNLFLVAKGGNSAADVKLEYTGEFDVSPAKPQAVAEKIKKLAEAGGDPWETNNEPTDEDWEFLGIIFY